jgi:hypothetical protein
MVAEGIDPREHRKAQREAASLEASKTVNFEQAAERFIAAHDAGWRNVKHRHDWRSSLKMYAYPIMGELPVQAIDVAAAMRVFDQDTSLNTQNPSP